MGLIFSRDYKIHGYFRLGGGCPFFSDFILDFTHVTYRRFSHESVAQTVDLEIYEICFEIPTKEMHE